MINVWRHSEALRLNLTQFKLPKAIGAAAHTSVGVPLNAFYRGTTAVFVTLETQPQFRVLSRKQEKTSPYLAALLVCTPYVKIWSCELRDEIRHRRGARRLSVPMGFHVSRFTLNSTSFVRRSEAYVFSEVLKSLVSRDRKRNRPQLIPK